MFGIHMFNCTWLYPDDKQLLKNNVITKKNQSTNDYCIIFPIGFYNVNVAYN